MGTKVVKLKMVYVKWRDHMGRSGYFTLDEAKAMRLVESETVVGLFQMTLKMMKSLSRGRLLRRTIFVKEKLIWLLTSL